MSDAVTVEQLCAAVGNVPLSNYYTKSETSSKQQIDAALNGKQAAGSYLSSSGDNTFTGYINVTNADSGFDF